MSIVASALSFVFLILSIIIRKTKSIKPSTVFFAVWTFVLLLSSLNIVMLAPGWLRGICLAAGLRPGGAVCYKLR